MKIVGRFLVGIVVILMTAWGAGAIYYSPLPGELFRSVLAWVFVGSTILAFLLFPRRRRTLLGFFSVFAVIVVLWLQIPASNERDWQPEVATTPYATINGDLVTIHGVRNFDYRTETDFDVRWETRTYDLRELDSADLIAVYWIGKPIAHIMVSFGFGEKDHLAVSIEARKERDEGYSTTAGFFKKYELIYIFADERDVIRLRTSYRQPQEDVHVYRLRTQHNRIRRVFLEYIKTINEMREQPRFYNTLTTNCTTPILLHARVNPGSPPMSWKILVSGYLPDYLYELERIDTSLPFTELERISHVNGKAHAAEHNPAFSQRIREGLPIPPPLE